MIIYEFDPPPWEMRLELPAGAARVLKRWLLVVLLALFSSGAAAQTYTQISTIYAWDTVSNSVGISGDDSATSVPIGFSFPFGGVSYSTAAVNTNGWVNFAGTNASYNNTALPFSNNGVFLFFDDMNVVAGTTGFTYGTLGTAPNRRFVLSYTNYPHLNNTNYSNMQLVLYESGLIEMRYGTMTTVAGGNTSTIGVQVSSTDFTQVSGSPNINTMPSNSAIAFACAGLMAQYHNNTTLSSPAMTRVDTTVNFDWGSGSPAAAVNADNFSVRWSGSLLVPTTGMYTFQTLSDDGVRLSVNGQRVINNWTVHGPTYDTSSAVYLVAGTRYPIEMDMYEASVGAVAVLNWKRPGDTVFSVIPAGNGTQGLYAHPVAVVPDPGVWKGALWWSRAGSSGAADNGGMASWTNEVDSSKPLTASAIQPKLRNNNSQNINFNPVVEFSRTGNTASTATYFQAPAFMGAQQANQTHVYTVGYAKEVTDGFEFVEGVHRERVAIHHSWLDGNIHWAAGDYEAGGRDIGVVRPSINAPRLSSYNKDAQSPNMPRSGNQSVAVNGVLVASHLSSPAFIGNASSAFVGWFPIYPNASWSGVLAEGVFLFNTTITPVTTSQIESYLAVKYGFTLGGGSATTTSYLNSVGGTIWQANTGYHNNIVGIGRDDTTKLNQLISRSGNSGDQITIISGSAMPSIASVITPTTGTTALATDRSYTLIGDNGQSAIATAVITAGAQSGRTRSARIWRLQMTGTVPTQLSICIPDTMLPSGFTAGDWSSDLWLSTATTADFSTGTASATMTSTTCVASGLGVTNGVPGRLATISNTVLNGMGGVGYFSVSRKMLDHIEITAGANTGVTCAPTTYTVKACGDASCSSLYTGGLTGTLTLTGTGVTSLPSGGAPFTIAAGQSSTTVSAQVLTVSTATVGASGLSLTPGNAKPVFCGLGATAASANSCAMTVGSAGFLLSVPNHYAGASQALSIKAVRSSDNAQVCLPAFANVTRAVKATCSYVNPSSGTVPVQLGAVKLNSGNTNSACDATGQNVNLAFDATGAASTTLSYWDAGRARLSLAYSGSVGNNDAGLSLVGSADFIAAPMGFIVTDYPSVATAGSPFNFKIKALAWGSNTNVLPNFGQESPREGVVLDWVRSEPVGSGAQTGSFAGSVGLFSGGVADVSNASWSEVGRVSPSARLASASYLSSGLNSAGNPIGIMGWAYCASESGGSANSCVIPSGVTAAVYFGYTNAAVISTGQSGSVACSIANFGDPMPGQNKACYYTALSGAGNVATHIQVRPARLEVTTTPACGSFSYSGQPFAATVTAKNALNAVTQNYAGVVARAVSFSDSSANASGALSGSVPSNVFSLGVANLSTSAATAPLFSFNNKLTAPQTISLRATDTDGISSSGYDGSQTLRSGRLQMSNAFGSDKSSLQIPLQLQYWSGKSWVKNSVDTCTAIPTASVVLAQTRNHNNSVPNWNSAVSGINLSGGTGFITLAAPSPAGTGTVDLAINLGVGLNTQDLSCLAQHPSSTGARLAWLRSRQGSCASTFDRDPSARATFGVYAPETRRLVHVREIF